MAEDNDVIRQMRDQIKQLTKERDDLLPYRDRVVELDKRTVATSLGFDGDLPPGLVKLHGDGEFTADALRKTAEENGWNLPDPTATAATGQGDLPEATAARIDAQKAIDNVRSQATPVAGQRMSMEDFNRLSETDGPAATAAWVAGQVDVPPHVAAQLAANDRSIPLGR